MKNLFKLEVLKTNKTLTAKEQNGFRSKFKPFLNMDGLSSLCLEDDHLYIEYGTLSFNVDSFKDVLTNSGFPLNHENRKLKLADSSVV
ncbi:hypothetical protein JM83_1833 [Gillisia sp. Hel_I_86]|uniref:hypothetical protein n=1 Tax=Gillisia sp. Hel_I_86 TaxID=1249981 RepID=UPI00119A352A|nr:hypothetical protein [Gillisia sp. Hel_I_86]TVZ26842.1 hypothetical protein JM83_1833 [Gillisia sp. Hel_I_86]